MAVERWAGWGRGRGRERIKVGYEAVGEKVGRW